MVDDQSCKSWGKKSRIIRKGLVTYLGRGFCVFIIKDEEVLKFCYLVAKDYRRNREKVKVARGLWVGTFSIHKESCDILYHLPVSGPQLWQKSWPKVNYLLQTYLELTWGNFQSWLILLVWLFLHFAAEILMCFITRCCSTSYWGFS